MEAGNTLEQSVALVASANKVVQDPNSVGSALRTISLRLRGTSVSVLEEMGEETDGVVESVSKMQKKIEALTGVNILTDSGAYKDTYTILQEIGTVWEDMADIDQAALLELMAGKNRANTLAAILGNMKDLEGAYNDALNAEGSALKENAAYLDSIQGRIDLFNNAVQTMWMNFVNDDVIKFFVNIGTHLIRLVDLVNPLNVAIAGLFTGMYAKYKKFSLSNFMFDTVPTKVKNGVTSIFDAQMGQHANKQVVNLVASGTVEYTKYAQAIQSVSAAKQVEILMNNGVAESEQLLILTQTLGSETAAKQAIANAKLSASNTSVSASMVGQLVNTGALTTEQAAATVSTLGLVTAEGESVVITKVEALAKLEAAVATGALSAADKEAIVSTLGLGTANTFTTGTFVTLAKSIWGAITALVKFLALTPVGWITLAAAAIIGLITAYNKFGPTHENYIKKLEEETEELKSVQSELKSVQSELENTAKRIDELNAKGTLSFVEKEELDRLKQQTEELERQEKILSAQEKRARNKQIETALKAVQTDSDLQKIDFMSIFSAAVANTTTGSMGLTGQDFSTKNVYVDAYQENIDELKKAKEDLEEAQTKLANTTYRTESKEYKKLEKDVEKAQNRVDKYNNAIDSINETWQTKYGEIGYVENATTEAEKKWNEFYRQHQDYLDQQALINDDYGKSTVLDRIFSTTGTDVAQKFKKEFESSVKSGKNPAEVIENLLANEDYSSAFTGLEKQFGITLDNIKGYFTQTGEFAVEDPKFDITKYTKAISSHSAVITEYQEALQSLDKGSFTMDDFMALIEKYPDLAKGVDISSKAFYGLSRNLNKAIKTQTKGFIDDLKELKKSLIAAGESTESIDQLIEAVENMPEDALDTTIEKYGTLADTINRAKLAQDKLTEAMGQNNNEGYETRGEALEFIKDKLSRGEAGSESEVWDVAKEYGYIYDHTKSLNENADAMAKWAAVRETWFKKDDDGNYLFEGTENFIKTIDDVIDKIPELQQLLTWDYDENTGILNFDLDNSNLPEIISLLSTTQEFAHLTAEEWSDMMIQIGQYYDVNWSNFDDILDELSKIANGASDAKTKVEEYGKAMQEYFGKGDVDLTNRPEITKEKMQQAGWTDFEDGYATVYSSTYNKSDFMELEEGETDTSVVLTPILPDKTVLSPERLKEYAEKILKGEEIDIEGITLGVFDNQKELSGFEEALHNAQAEYHELMDSYNIGAVIDESGLQGLREIKDLQDIIQSRSDGTVVINEDAFRTVLTEAGYTENKIDSLIDKIKILDDEAFDVDPLKIDETLLNNGLSKLKEIEELRNAIAEDSKTGLTVFDTDAFRTVLDDAGYAKDHIDELIKKIQEYNGIVSTSGSTDPLGINAVNMDINTLKASLSTLGVEFKESIGTWFDGKKDFTINVTDLVTTLKAKNWTDEAIKSYCTQLSNSVDIEGFNIKVQGIENIDEVISKSNEVPEEEKTKYTVEGSGLQTLKDIKTAADSIPESLKTVHTTEEITVKKTVIEDSNSESSGGWLNKLFGGTSANGTAHINGTAYSDGSWGASQTETSLVGELGPELLVRNGRWTTVGENGAEFTQIKRGDIIFNHKQTESLLKNGYVTGRGRAYASGTAYASGGGTFGRYEFSGEGGYTKYDVNNNIVDQFGNATSNLSGAASDLSDAADEFNETIDWIEIRLEEINEQLDLLNAQMENAVGYLAKNQIIDKTIDLNKTKLSNLKAGMVEYEAYAEQLLSKVPTQYRDAVQNGMISITEFTGEANEETVEAINNYREWAQKVADLRQQIEELEGEIVELAKTKFDNISEEYDNIVGLIENANEKLDAQISLMEDRGYVASKQYYESMMINTQQMQNELKKEKVALQSVFDEQVKLGNIKVGSDAWYEMVGQLYEVDASIVDCTSDLESYQNAINDIYWSNFDELINRIDYLKDETQSLIDLMDSDKLVITPESEDGWSADDVKWTEEGIASLGLYAQQMEIAEYKAKQYANAIDDLNSDYAAGKYSEYEYLEKLNELTSAQYDSIEAYYDAQDAIKDLNKARVDEIKNGIEKQIDAYEKLIDKKKELLDAEKDAVDFQRSIEESNKEISDIERQIAALSSDNSASARAKRAKLQAELAQAQQDLQDKFYDRSIEDQQEALDKELEHFQEEKDAEMTKWEEYLEDVEKVLTDSLSIVKDSATNIYDTLNSKADEYSLTLSDSIMSPWQNGSLAISDYQTTFDTAMSSTMDQLSSLKKEWQSIIDLMAKAAGTEIASQNKENNNYTSATSSKTTTSTYSSNTTATVVKPTIKVGGKINAGNAKIFSYAGATSGYKQYYSDDPIYKVLAIDGDWIQVRHHKLSTGVTGWFKKGHVNAYAKGTTGVNQNQLALIDELGDELVMHADGNGKLAFLSKGSAVIPHDISENLMQLGELNPQDVLDRNRPAVNAPHITNNNIELNVSFGEVVHIDHVDNNAVPNLAKTVEKQIEKYMKGLNAEIRKFTR